MVTVDHRHCHVEIDQGAKRIHQVLGAGAGIYVVYGASDCLDPFIAGRLFNVLPMAGDIQH